jgi:hypothetical protein
VFFPYGQTTGRHCQQDATGAVGNEARADPAEDARHVQPRTAIAERSKDMANMTQPDVKAQIAAQLYTTLERLGADEELLAIVGSMSDTLTDKEVLRMLEDYNKTGNVFRQPQ